MINITTGAPGNGKSLLVQSETIEEYLFGDRDIVTSTPVRVDPWVTGDGRVMLGLREFLRLDCKQEELPERIKLAPGVVAFGRMLIVEDEEQLGNLFMWRRDRKTGDWFKMRWDAESEQFNADDVGRMRGGCLVVTDEAWKCYNSRRWKDTEKVVEFYGRQHRKFADDWVIVSHSHKDLDVQLNRMGQAWRICMNYGLRRLGVFRQPPLFEVKTYYEAPSSSNVRCFHSKITRLNPKIVQTYDTSAGVAVGGGRAADVKRRRSGISPWWALPMVLAVMALVWFGPSSVMRWFLKPFVQQQKAIGRPVSVSVPPVASSAVRPGGLVTSASPAELAAPVREETNLVTMRGYGISPIIKFGTIVGKKIEVYLSDGRRVHAGDGHLQYLCEDYCVVDGKTNMLHEESSTVGEGNIAPPASYAPTVAPQSLSSVDSGGSSLYIIPHHVNSMAHPPVRSATSGGIGGSFGGGNYQQNY